MLLRTSSVSQEIGLGVQNRLDTVVVHFTG